MKSPDDLPNRPMLQLSEVDVLRFRDIIEGGTLVIGELGSGKSSTSGRAHALALSFLEAGIGGLVPTVNPDELKSWMEYVAKTGRSKDLILAEQVQQPCAPAVATPSPNPKQ